MDMWHECPWKEQLKNCSVQHRLVEGLEAVPELDGEITWKILVGLTLASQQSIYPLLQKIEVLGGSNSSCFPRDPPRISGLENEWAPAHSLILCLISVAISLQLVFSHTWSHPISNSRSSCRRTVSAQHTSSNGGPQPPHPLDFHPFLTQIFPFHNHIATGSMPGKVSCRT